MLQAKKAKKPKKPNKQSPKPKSAFAHTGMFDILAELDTDDTDEAVDFEDLESEDETTPLLAGAAPSDQTNTPPPPAVKTLGEGERPVSRFMPVWKSDFWNVYGNLLRVNGTAEGLCDLMSGASRH